MANLKDDITIAAQWFSDALTKLGYQADFSIESIKEVERFLKEHTKKGKPKFFGQLRKDFGRKIFGCGSYIGEVLRQHLGGEWVTDDTDPAGELNVSLRFPNSGVCWPIQRTIKRIKNGDEDSLVAYAIGLGLTFPDSGKTG